MTTKLPINGVGCGGPAAGRRRALCEAMEARTLLATVTFTLAVDDNGSGAYTAGNFAVYADVTNGSAGLASFQVSVANAATLENLSPRTVYQDSGGEQESQAGFTLLRAASPITGGFTATGSQDTIDSNATLIFGMGQTAGSFAAHNPFPGGSQGSTTQNTWSAHLLLATGTYAGAAPQLSEQGGIGANVFTASGNSATEGATVVTNATAFASISGRVFNDKNASGFFDGDDEGISGFRVFLDTNHNEILDEGEISKPVSGTGTFTFSGVEPGTYRLRQVSRQGWRVAYPALGHYDVTLHAGNQAKSLSFANTQGVLVKGTVWHDSNQDRLIQPIEARLARWRVIVDLNKNGIWDEGDVSKETNGRGQYRLSLLTQVGAGDGSEQTYHVMARQIEGYRQTTNGGSHHTITLPAGGTTSNKNFGFKRLK